MQCTLMYEARTGMIDRLYAMEIRGKKVKSVFVVKGTVKGKSQKQKRGMRSELLRRKATERREQNDMLLHTYLT